MRSFMEVTYDEDRYILIENVVAVRCMACGGLAVLDDEDTEYYLSPGFVCVAYGAEIEEDEEDDAGGQPYLPLADEEPVQVNFEYLN